MLVSDLCCFHLREHMHARDEFSELEYFLSVSRLTLPNTHKHTDTKNSPVKQYNRAR